MSRCIAVLTTVALLSTVAADDVALKYTELAEGAQASRNQQLSEVEQKVKKVVKNRNSLIPAAYFDYLKTHPKEAAGVVLAGSLIARELTSNNEHVAAVVQQFTRMLRGALPPPAPLPSDLKKEAETSQVLEKYEDTEEAVEGGDIQLNETAADVTEVAAQADDINAHADDIDIHATGPMTWQEYGVQMLHAMKQPVNIVKIVVGLVSFVVFFALRRHAHQKAARSLQKNTQKKEVPVPAPPRVIRLDGTGGFSNTPRV